MRIGLRPLTTDQQAQRHDDLVLIGEKLLGIVVSSGMYAVLYAPASASKVLPAEINTKALAAVTKSPMPLLRDTQIGDTGRPNLARLRRKRMD